MTRPPADFVRVEPRELVRNRARGRARFVGVVFGLLLAGLGVRGAQLCLEPQERTLQAGSVQRWGQVTIRARRGDIHDRHGRRLATSVDTPSVAVDPALVSSDEVAELAEQVARILQLPVSEVADKMRRDSRYAKLAARVHPAVARQIQELGHRALWTHRDPRRYYPEEGLAAQIVGFVDANGVGRTGIEGAMDDHLRGGAIVLQHRRSRGGYDVDPTEVQQSPADGLAVHTTLDRVVQRAAERALAGVMERHEPRAAYATVVDVRTGDILAMANAPGFNPNAIGGDPARRRNRVVQDAPELGSVMKPFAVAAALEEGIVTEDTLVDCENGTWYVGRTRIRDDHPHKVISLGEVVKFSSNIGTAKLALDLGARRFLRYMHDFGFGRRTGILLPGERRGRLRSADRIKPIELATTSYGQGMTSTQLQLAMATAAIANGGVLMEPRIVTRVEDTDGVAVWTQDPVEVRRVVSERTADAVARMMASVTEAGGTGTRARIPGYRVAGKTGTAEKVEDGRYSDARIGSFTGFVPADDPAVAIVVTVDEPSKGSRYGGVVAGPAFAEIGAYTLRHLGIAPDPALLDGEALADTDDEPRPEPTRLAWNGGGWTLPDVRGRSMREVLASLQGAGLDLELRGSGVAVAQAPPPGEPVPPGGLVSVTFR